MNTPMQALILLIGLTVASAPISVYAHPKGLYDSQQQAEQRAKEIGCQGAHQNNSKWMPCSNEAALHQHLRHH
ncbi:MAG: DUF3721 domain-containing protein [Cyanobium sp.]